MRNKPRWGLLLVLGAAVTTKVAADRPAPTLAEQVEQIRTQEALDLEQAILELQGATDEHEGLAHQRQIESRKHQAEREILEVQARIARRAGNAALARTIQMVIGRTDSIAGEDSQ